MRGRLLYPPFNVHICRFPDLHPVLAAAKGKSQTDWNAKAQQELKEALAWKPNVNVAKNVIIFLGDGMGPSTVTAARFYMAQSQGRKIEDTALAWERFPNVALSKVTNNVT